MGTTRSKAAAPEVIEAEAKVIEEGVAPLSGLDALIGEITGEAERLAKEYLPHDIRDEDDFKQSKRERTGARKDIAALKSRYAEKMRVVKDAVAEADLRMKSAIDPLDAIDRGYKLKVDEYTARWTNQRVAALREAYEDFAPDLALPQEGADAALVPFNRLLGRYGNERGAQWTSRTVTEAKAENAMHEAVAEIAKAEKTIDSMVEEAYREQAKARYFRTLDLQATLNEEAEAKAQRERVARLEAERREREAAEAARIAAEEQRAAEDAWLEQQASRPPEPDVVRVVAPPSYATEATVVDMAETTPGTTGRVYRDEPIPPAPHAYEPVPTPPAPPAQPQEVAHEWVVSVISARSSQMEALAAYMRESGIMFDKIYSGAMPTAYAKWSRENAR